METSLQWLFLGLQESRYKILSATGYWWSFKVLQESKKLSLPKAACVRSDSTRAAIFETSPQLLNLESNLKKETTNVAVS